MLSLDLMDTIRDGLVIDGIGRRRPLIGTAPILVLSLKAPHGLLQDRFLGWELPALDFLADKNR